MVLKLYGNPLSTYVKIVAVVLYEKNVPFEFHVVDYSKGENKTPEYLEKQPFGQVPYFEDDGFGIYESRAIARYIAEKYADRGPALIPTDLKKKALFEQAASIEVNNFNAYASPAVFEKLFKPYLNLTPDPAVYEKLFSQLEAKLDVYEKILSKQRYLAGDELTLADLFHLPYGVLLPQAGCNWTENRPNVARWFKELTERESWKAVKDGVKPIAA
ncbi:glutathione S-transferase [Coprinopsis cinerea AmutBmut pab1-1]|nr:glutathione S-transferase [Coprinopsis cinerea AmutBmut pab1-1]